MNMNIDNGTVPQAVWQSISLRGLVLLLLIYGLPDRVLAQDIVVDPAGPVQSLQKAVDLAPPHARILVRASVYREPTIVIDKPLEIIGERGAILDGGGQHQLVTVTADSVVIRGLRFRNVGVSFMEDRAAIKVDGGQYVVIEQNEFEDTFFAVYLAKAAHGRVAFNEIHGYGSKETNSGNGIHLWYCKDILIEGNHIQGHRDGIYLEFAERSTVVDNVSEKNLRYGLHFMFSDHSEYRGNVFRGNDAGVAVMYTKDIKMLSNHFEQNWGSAAYGLLLKDITDSQIAGNVFLRNTVAVYAEGTNRTTISENEFVENGWAVRIMANCLDNAFTRNNFVANTFDVATNSRNSFISFDNNYWDNYKGYDLDRDGIGDVPFFPVRLFSLIVEQNEPTLILLKSLFIELLDTAERVLPVLTPKSLVDDHPRMRRIS